MADSLALGCLVYVQVMPLQMSVLLKVQNLCSDRTNFISIESFQLLYQTYYLNKIYLSYTFLIYLKLFDGKYEMVLRILLNFRPFSTKSKHLVC